MSLKLNVNTMEYNKESQERLKATITNTSNDVLTLLRVRSLNPALGISTSLSDVLTESLLPVLTLQPQEVYTLYLQITGNEIPKENIHLGISWEYTSEY